MSKPAKADKAEVARRVEEVLRIRIDGAQFHDVRTYADEPARAWGVTDRELWALIGKADDLLVARTERKRARATALHVAQRQALYARAVNAADFGAALAALRDLAALQGLYPSPPKVAELTKIVKAQDELIQELESRGPEIRSLEASPGTTGTGDEVSQQPDRPERFSTGFGDGGPPGPRRRYTPGGVEQGP